MGARGELYTTQVTLDNRSYFFNVKENRNGDIFLQVVESKSRNGEDFDRHAIVVFADDMQKFFKGLDSSISFIEKEQKERSKAAAEVNKQIHVSFMLTTPLVMSFLLAMPLIILTLYTKDFMPMASICVMAGLFQLHRSVALPLEYVSLAHGHSWMFLILECIYNVLVIASVHILYNIWGLAGIGIALSFVGVSNTILLSIVNYYFYGIRISNSNID